MGYVDEANLVQLKGRVACEINQQVILSDNMCDLNF